MSGDRIQRGERGEGENWSWSVVVTACGTCLKQQETRCPQINAGVATAGLTQWIWVSSMCENILYGMFLKPCCSALYTFRAMSTDLLLALVNAPFLLCSEWRKHWYSLGLCTLAWGTNRTQCLVLWVYGFISDGQYENDVTIFKMFFMNNTEILKVVIVAVFLGCVAQSPTKINPLSKSSLSFLCEPHFVDL